MSDNPSNILPIPALPPEPPPKPIVMLWENQVRYDILTLKEWAGVLSDYVKVLNSTISRHESELGALASKIELEILQETLESNMADLEQLKVAADSVKRFAESQLDITTDAQKAIGLEGRVSRLENAIKSQHERKGQRTNMWLTVAGILLSAGIGIAALIVAILN